MKSLIEKSDIAEKFCCPETSGADGHHPWPLTLCPCLFSLPASVSSFSHTLRSCSLCVHTSCVFSITTLSFRNSPAWLGNTAWQKSRGSRLLRPQLQGWSGPRPVLPRPLDKRVWEGFRSMFPFSLLFCFCDEMPEKTLECGGLLQLTVWGCSLQEGKDNSRWLKIGGPAQLGLLSLIKQEAEKRQEVRWVGLLSSMPRSQWVSCFGQQGSTSQAYLTRGHWATTHRRQLWTQNS